MNIWDFLSVSPPDNKYVGSESGKCFVIGTGHTIWDDLKKAGFQEGQYKQDAGIIAVNRSIQDLPCHVDHAYSNHHRGLVWWIQGRDEVHLKKDKHQKPTILHTNGNEQHRFVHWPFPGNGTSTLNAVYLAFSLGYNEICVVGTPMDNGPHYYDPPWHVTNFENSHNIRFWSNAKKRLFGDRVKIYSNNLKELLK